MSSPTRRSGGHPYESPRERRLASGGPASQARLPGPTELVGVGLRTGLRVVGFQIAVARELMRVPIRLLAVMDSVEQLLMRVQGILDEVTKVVLAIDVIIAAAAETVDSVDDTVNSADAVVARVDHTVDTADGVVSRVDHTIDSANVVVGRVDATIDSANTVVGRVDSTIDSANVVVGRVDTTIDGADALLGRVVPMLDFGESALASVQPVLEALLTEVELDAEAARLVAIRLTEVLVFVDKIVALGEPVATEVLESIDPDEVRAMVHLIDHLPALTTSLEKDVLPVLSSLDTVAPEVHQILTVEQDCLDALAGLPGFSFFRKRGEDRQDE